MARLLGADKVAEGIVADEHRIDAGEGVALTVEAANRDIHVGIGEHDRRRLAAEFQRYLLQIAGSRLHDQLADYGQLAVFWGPHRLAMREAPSFRQNIRPA